MSSDPSLNSINTPSNVNLTSTQNTQSKASLPADRAEELFTEVHKTDPTSTSSTFRASSTLTHEDVSHNLAEEFERVVGRKLTTEEKKGIWQTVRDVEVKDLATFSKYMLNQIKSVDLKTVYFTTPLYLFRLLVVVPAKYIMTYAPSAQVAAASCTPIAAAVSWLIVANASVGLYSTIKASRTHKKWMKKADISQNVIAQLKPDEGVKVKPLKNRGFKKLEKKYPDLTETEKEGLEGIDRRRIQHILTSYPNISKDDFLHLITAGNMEKLLEVRQQAFNLLVDKIKTENPTWSDDQAIETAKKYEAASTPLLESLSTIAIKKHAMERKFFRLNTADEATKLALNATMAPILSVMSVLEGVGVIAFPPIILMIPMCINASKWSVFQAVKLGMYARYRPNLLKLAFQGIALKKIGTNLPATMVTWGYAYTKKKTAKLGKQLERKELALQFLEEAQSLQKAGQSIDQLATPIKLLANSKLPKQPTAAQLAKLQEKLSKQITQLQTEKTTQDATLIGRTAAKAKWKLRVQDINDKQLIAGGKDFRKGLQRGQNFGDTDPSEVLDTIAEAIVSEQLDMRTVAYLEEQFGVDMQALHKQIQLAERVKVREGNKTKRFFRSLIGIQDISAKEGQQIFALETEETSLQTIIAHADPASKATLEASLAKVQAEKNQLEKEQVLKALDRFLGLREKPLIAFIQKQKKAREAKGIEAA